ncbi:MAG: LamG domain-containing protein [Deltaproteobacteria bacterium]|nr:LamG domain-containing protein [Deltaproteobacteria bacterium]
MRNVCALLAASVLLASAAAGSCASTDGLSGGGADAATPDVAQGTSDGDAPRTDGGTEGGGPDASDASGGGCNPGTVPDLVGYYAFEEGAGTTAHDCSGNGRDGTILRVATDTWTTGLYGKALRVKSPDGCVDLGKVDAFDFKGGFTVMAWANTTTFPSSTSDAIVGKSSDLGVAGWRMYAGFVQEYGAGVFVPGSGALFVGKEPLPPATWTHLATRFTPNGNLAFFVDGVNVAEKTWSSALVEDPTTNVRIGCRGDGAGFFDGIIDEVRLYARALTPTEIAILSRKP